MRTSILVCSFRNSLYASGDDTCHFFQIHIQTPHILSTMEVPRTSRIACDLTTEFPSTVLYAHPSSRSILYTNQDFFLNVLYVLSVYSSLYTRFFVLPDLRIKFYFHRSCIHVHYTSELQGVTSNSPLILIHCVFRGPSDHVLVSWAVKGQPLNVPASRNWITNRFKALQLSHTTSDDFHPSHLCKPIKFSTNYNKSLVMGSC